MCPRNSCSAGSSSHPVFWRPDSSKARVCLFLCTSSSWKEFNFFPSLRRKSVYSPGLFSAMSFNKITNRVNDLWNLGYTLITSTGWSVLPSALTARSPLLLTLPGHCPGSSHRTGFARFDSTSHNPRSSFPHATAVVRWWHTRMKGSPCVRNGQSSS